MKTLAFGEILWDIMGNEAHIGGAPFNLAAHLAKMGAESHLISAVGDDGLGVAAVSAARKTGIDASLIQTLDDSKTGTVHVELRPDGSHDFSINGNVAWESVALSEEALREISSGDWDFFAFGTLAQRSQENRDTLDKIFEALPRETVIAYDVNLRQSHYAKEWIEKSLDRCDIAKLNEDEAKLLSLLLFDETLSMRDFSQRLAEKHSVGIVCVTLGAEGSRILCSAGWGEIAPIRVQVADTVGAGDAFTAGLLFALRHSCDPFEAAKFAGKAGAFVASMRGAVPDYSKEFETEVQLIRKRPEK